MQKEIVEKINSPRISVFVIWLPVMGADNYQSAQQAQAIFPDARVKQWWDQHLAVGQGYRKILPLATECKLAWDVYLLYPRGIKRFRYSLDSAGKKGWTPPAPDFWMHQLSCMTKENYFNAEVLRETIENMLTQKY